MNTCSHLHMYRQLVSACTSCHSHKTYTGNIVQVDQANFDNHPTPFQDVLVTTVSFQDVLVTTVSVGSREGVVGL